MHSSAVTTSVIHPLRANNVRGTRTKESPALGLPSPCLANAHLVPVKTSTLLVVWEFIVLPPMTWSPFSSILIGGQQFHQKSPLKNQYCVALIFSVTRRSRNDVGEWVSQSVIVSRLYLCDPGEWGCLLETWLMWLWWVRTMMALIIMMTWCLDEDEDED